MNTAQSFAVIAKPIAHQFRHVAPTSLDWASEREFLYAQIFRPGNEAVIEMIDRGVEETIESVRRAARSSAAMGLTMNPTAALVYFIPRRARKRNSELYPDDKSEAHYKSTVPWIIGATPSYRGLAFVCTHYSGFDDVLSEVVFKADSFVYHGPFEKPLHVPTLDNALRTEKNAIGAYALFVKQGRIRTEYVDAPTIAMVRSMSDNSNGLMWTKFWTEGWRKVAVRRGSKLAMQSAGIVPSGGERWTAAEDAMQAADGVTLDETGAPVNVPRGTPDPAEPTSGAQASAAKPRGMGGLRDRMTQATTRSQEAQTETELEPASKALLALPAPSKHPEGSIEWWLDQVHAGGSDARLDEIKVAALAAGVDRTEDADSFRRVFAERKKELRGPPGSTRQLV